MPDRSKVHWSQLKVGILALAAMAIAGVLIFLLTGTTGVFENYVLIRTYMDDASGIAEKSPVRLNGILIGYLDELRLTPSGDPSRVVEFRMEIKEEYLSQIPRDSVAGIAAANLLGDKFINITKGQSPQHVEAGGELPSLEARDIPELMAQSANLLQSLQTIVKRADSLLAGVEAGEGNIGKFLKDEELYTRLNAIAAQGQRLLVDIRTGKGTISRLIYDDSLYQEIRAPIRRIDALLADLQQGQGTAGKLLKDPAVYEEARASIAEIRKLVAGLQQGRGTAGKLLKDEELYRQVNQLVRKLDLTIDRMNSGQGTLGQLVVNPQLYDSLSGATREFQALAKDIRANPKKFLRIRLSLF
jgi:phospholipid/cholesterol/gamma-HCH transport system substrate-binding protein